MMFSAGHNTIRAYTEPIEALADDRGAPLQVPHQVLENFGLIFGAALAFYSTDGEIMNFSFSYLALGIIAVALMLAPLSAIAAGDHDENRSMGAAMGKTMGMGMSSAMHMDKPGVAHGDAHDSDRRVEGTRNDAAVCREDIMGGDAMMDDEEMKHCIDLVSSFEGLGMGNVITVRMITDASGKNRFDPELVNIKRGDTVKWVLENGVHNAVAYPNRIPNTGQPFEAPLLTNPGDAFFQTFLTSGTYEYHCHPHEALGMRGSVIVDRPSEPDEFRKMRKGKSAHAHR